MSEETLPPAAPAPAAPAPVVPVVVAAPPAAPAFDMAAIQAKANADALASVQKAITGALGLAPEVQLDPATVLRTAEQALSRAAIQNEAVRAGVRDPARFAATLTGNPAFAVDLQTGALRNAEAARAAVAAEIVAAPFWLPTPAAPQNGSVQVQANQPLPPAPPPPASPTHVPAQSAPLTIQNVFNRAASALRR